MHSQRPQYYKLIGRLPVPVYDVSEWTKVAEIGTDAWRIAETVVGPLHVSTIFLGLDHNWSPDSDALAVLFETVVLGDDSDMKPPTNLRELLLGNQYQRRYATWDEAEQGHDAAVEWARQRVAEADAVLLRGSHHV